MNHGEAKGKPDYAKSLSGIRRPVKVNRDVHKVKHVKYSVNSTDDSQI